MARKSLTHGLDIPDKAAEKASKAASASEPIPPAKIALVVGLLVIAAAVPAWYFGAFEALMGGPKFKNAPVAPQGNQITPEVQKQMDDRAKRLELPAGDPKKPTIGAS